MTARSITDSRRAACAAHSIGGRIPSGAAAPALFHLGERELAVADPDADAVARSELSLEDLLRQRILDLLLDGSLQRSRTVHRIEAGLPEAVAGGTSSSARSMKCSRVTTTQSVASIGSHTSTPATK